MFTALDPSHPILSTTDIKIFTFYVKVNNFPNYIEIFYIKNPNLLLKNIYLNYKTNNDSSPFWIFGVFS